MQPYCCGVFALLLGQVAHVQSQAPAPARWNPAPAPVSPCPYGALNPTHDPLTPCSNRGYCHVSTKTCWCKVGFAGVSCEKEAPLFLRITWVALPELQEMVGLYRAEGFFLKPPGKGHLAEDKAHFLFYSQQSQGWALGKFNSNCTDDTCMFGYAPDHTLPRYYPPPKGWSFSGTDNHYHVYYKQMIWDDADVDPDHSARGYFQDVAYTHDPQTPNPRMDLSEFNGKYSLQPRYVHVDNGKFAIFPEDLKQNGGKKWVAAGLVDMPRKWKVLATAVDKTANRYFPPVSPVWPDLVQPWTPQVFAVVNACANHLLDVTCWGLSATCLDPKSASPDVLWIRQCCRSACNSCKLSRFSCKLPKSNPLIMAALNQSVHTNVFSPAPPPTHRFRGSAGKLELENASQY